mgnify:CR=1 FL=1
MLAPFHLAIPVHELAAARRFYGTLFGCAEGRSAHDWVDFDFFGHQLVAHVDPTSGKPTRVGFKMTADGKGEQKKVRFAKRSGVEIDG